MDRKDRRPSGCGIVLLVLFFPYSLIYLAIKAFQDSGNDLKKKGSCLLGLGVFLVASGIICIVATLTGWMEGDPAGFPMLIAMALIVFCGGGAALIVWGSVLWRRHRIYERYVNVVLNSGESRLSGIAAILGTDRQTVLRELEMILGTGELKSAYIDHQTDRIMLPPKKELPQDAVYCPSCGARQQVPPGQARFCEYCGSPIRR